MLTIYCIILILNIIYKYENENKIMQVVFIIIFSFNLDYLNIFSNIK